MCFRDFLPRGSGIVTRRPLVLQLIYAKQGKVFIMIGRELVAASAEPLVLSLLAKGETYGYAIIQEVKKLSGDQINWTDGMLYPVLHRMEDRGLIQSRWAEAETGRKRKYYSLKKDGKKELQKQREQWLTVHGTLAKLWKEKYV